MIELGGNIKLIGFNELEPAKLIVVKKVVGNYVKKVSEKVGGINELSLEKNNEKIIAKLIYNEKNLSSESENANLFFCLDKALNELNRQI